jgi:hypothetical protein
MRCRACNVELNDYESTLRDSQSDGYFDLCLECLTSTRQAVFDSELKGEYNVTKEFQSSEEEPKD